jgi:DNA-binding FrmR family transcriptional regulator
MKPTHTDITRRLKRIEGQIRSLADAIDNETDCESVIVQFRATKAALESAYAAYLEKRIDTCLQKNNPKLLTSILREISRQ